ncbi:MAG: 7-carboxy-7-deazaguanine synthase QueE [Gloeomargarita sp. DG02_4_bins_56]
MNATANLVEIFSAIQGEGIYVGERQIFLRLGGCDLRCRFCDSAHTWQPPPQGRVELTPGVRDFQKITNPVTGAQILAWLQRQFQGGKHQAISITGGEPLLQADFLAEFLPQLKKQISLPIYLETGGHRPQEFAQVLPWLDIIAMDYKLPSVSGENYHSEHGEFLRLAVQAGVEIFVKIILDRHTQVEELTKALAMMQGIDPQVLVILQPVTPRPTSPAPTPAQVLTWQTLAQDYLQRVRVIPQTHPLLGQL